MTTEGIDRLGFLIHDSARLLYMEQQATLEQMTLSIRREFDVEKRKGLLRDLQKYDAKMMFNQKIP